MGNEIPDQNVIRVWRHPTQDGWMAAIGPFDGRELKVGPHCNGPTALLHLMAQIQRDCWSFDPSWVPQRGIPRLFGVA